MLLEKLASAIRNDVVSGLQGYHTNFSISLELLIDTVTRTRLAVIKEFSLKGLDLKKELLLSLNCINIDCKDIKKCSCNSLGCEKPTAHFEIPQINLDYPIEYIGSTDRLNPFIYYTSSHALKYHSYRKRNKDKPYVWIDTSPNENGLIDCFVFNAPFLKQVSITAVFKDLKQVLLFGCCNEEEFENLSMVDLEVQRRVTEQYINYYRRLAAYPKPNDQQYTA